MFSNRVVDAHREQCDISAFVITKLVDNDRNPLFLEDWCTVQAEGGCFEIILLEKGYSQVRCTYVSQ